MKLITSLVILIILIILFPVAQAATKATGKVTLTVINLAPSIEELIITPQAVYDDSILKCDGIIDDEYPEGSKLQIAWYVNNKFVKRGESITDLTIGDAITCKAVAKDRSGQLSPEAQISVVVQKTPASTKRVKLYSSVLGTELNTDEAISLETQGFGAITGHAVRNSEFVSGTSVLFLLVIGLVFITLLNIRASMKRRMSIKH